MDGIPADFDFTLGSLGDEAEGGSADSISKEDEPSQESHADEHVLSQERSEEEGDSDEEDQEDEDQEEKEGQEDDEDEQLPEDEELEDEEEDQQEDDDELEEDDEFLNPEGYESYDEDLDYPTLPQANYHNGPGLGLGECSPPLCHWRGTEDPRNSPQYLPVPLTHEDAIPLP